MMNKEEDLVMFKSGRAEDIESEKVKELKKIVLDDIVFENDIKLSSLQYNKESIILKTIQSPNLMITILEDRINLTYKEDDKGILHVSIPSYINNEVNNELKNVLDLMFGNKGMTNRISYILKNKTYATFRFENHSK